MAHSRLKRLVSVAVAAVLVSTAGGVGLHAQPEEREAAAESYEDIQRRIAELQTLVETLEAQQSDIQEGIASTDRRRDALTIQLEELGAVLAQAQGRVDAINADLAAIEAELEAQRTQRDEAEAELADVVAKLEARARILYKRGPVTMFELLLGADSLGDLAHRTGLVMKAARVDNERVDSVVRQQRILDQARADIERLRDDVVSKVSEVRRERDRLRGIHSSVESKRAQAAAELRRSHAALGDIEAQKKAFLAEQAELEAESRAITSFLKGETDKLPEKPSVSANGMVWPVQGPLTSSYGWRTHPIYKTRRFHAGIDIGVPTGRPISAAASGTVIWARPRNGYGNTVIVDHGGGVATLYAHMSAIHVREDAKVDRGQTVGLIGCTGYCTGPHLHFEVRVNGEPDNPFNWLPG